MKVNTWYKLKSNFTIDDFFDVTSKAEFAAHLRENNKKCMPTRIESGQQHEVAYFVFDGVPYEYDLIEPYWDFFEEVEECEPDSSDSLLYPAKVSYPAKALNASDFTIKNLKIQTETAKHLEKLEIIEEPGLRTQDLLKFILDNIVCEHPTFDISHVLGKPSEEKEQLLWEIYKAYHAKIAIDNVILLAQKEESKLSNFLDSYSYDPLGASSGIF